jgi:hypothetical protein
MKKVILYYRGPSYTAAQWSARNPLLQRGEVGYLLHDTSGIVIGQKVGPGRWNDLAFSPDVLFDNPGPVTNPIGDVSGVIAGQNLMQVAEKMLFPYKVPVISNLTNNAQGGSPQVEALLEIGAAKSGVIRLLHETSFPENLSGATPINVIAGSIFSNEGNFANTGTIDMNLSAPLNPSVVTTYTINVKPTPTQGVGVTVSTTIKFVPRMIWGVSPLTSLTGPQMNSIAQKQTALTDNLERDCSFTTAGYGYLAIPAMLDPSNLIFTDVTNPDAPSTFSFEDLGPLSINNGVGTYNYQIFRTTYYITESLSRVRIRRQI